jgi:hypothetical protein
LSWSYVIISLGFRFRFKLLGVAGLALRGSLQGVSSPLAVKANRTSRSAEFLRFSPSQPKSRSDKNARLRGEIQKETQGMTPASTRHRPPAIPIAPLHHRHSWSMVEEPLWV